MLLLLLQVILSGLFGYVGGVVDVGRCGCDVIVIVVYAADVVFFYVECMVVFDCCDECVYIFSIILARDDIHIGVAITDVECCNVSVFCCVVMYSVLCVVVSVVHWCVCFIVVVVSNIMLFMVPSNM